MLLDKQRPHFIAAVQPDIMIVFPRFIWRKPPQTPAATLMPTNALDVELRRFSAFFTLPHFRGFAEFDGKTVCRHSITFAVYIAHLVCILNFSGQKIPIFFQERNGSLIA